MPAVYRCAHCGALHPIPFPFDDEQAFREFEFSRHQFRCEEDGQSAVYSEDAFLWIDGPETSSGP